MDLFLITLICFAIFYCAGVLGCIKIHRIKDEDWSGSDLESGSGSSSGSEEEMEDSFGSDEYMDCDEDQSLPVKKFRRRVILEQSK